MKLYQFDDKAFIFVPEGLERALLRDPRLHQRIGVTRGSIYKWRWGHATPSRTRAVLVHQYAPEAFARLEGLPSQPVPAPRPAAPVMVKPTAKPLPAKRLLMQINKRAGADGWARFSSCYGPAQVSATEAKAILAVLHDNGGVELRRLPNNQKGPDPLEVRIAEGARWLLQ